MDRLWLRLTGGEPGAAGDTAIARAARSRCRGRPWARRGSILPSSAREPLGARDYLRLAHAYDTLMHRARAAVHRDASSDAAKRFILLIDTLYDRGIKLAASFAVPLDQLGADDRRGRIPAHRVAADRDAVGGLSGGAPRQARPADPPKG